MISLSLKVTIQDGPKYCIVLEYSFNMKLIYIIDQSGKIFFEFEKKIGPTPLEEIV